jgi:hypothetical protein
MLFHRPRADLEFFLLSLLPPCPLFKFSTTALSHSLSLSHLIFLSLPSSSFSIFSIDPFSISHAGRATGVAWGGWRRGPVGQAR